MFISVSARGLPQLLLLCVSSIRSSHALALGDQTVALTTGGASQHRNATQLDRRDAVTEMSTCGYLNGTASQPRTANPGFDCRVDTQDGLWGFSPTTVIYATDCGLAGSCVDNYSCSNGCGLTGNTELTTFTCASTQRCSTALLAFGVDQIYSYIACGNSARTDYYLASPTTDTTVTSTSSAASTKPTTTVASQTSSFGSSSVLVASTPSVPSPTTAISAVPDSRPTDSGSANPANNTGAIIGGVIGGLVVMCGFGVAAIYLLRRGRSARAVPPPPEPVTLHSYQTDTPWYKKEGNHRFTGGWGPRELPESNSENSPVELSG